jgi:hypothetical protein
MNELRPCSDVMNVLIILYLGGWIANKRNQVEVFAEGQQGSQNPFSHPAFESLRTIFIFNAKIYFFRSSESSLGKGIFSLTINFYKFINRFMKLRK